MRYTVVVTTLVVLLASVPGLGSGVAAGGAMAPSPAVSTPVSVPGSANTSADGPGVSLDSGVPHDALRATGPASANDPPLADAGLDQTVDEGATVLLDGAGSRDLDGQITAYRWSIVAPNGSTTAPDCATCARTSFEATQVGTYTVTLAVTDDDGATTRDTLYVTVESAGDRGPSVTLTGSDRMRTSPIAVDDYTADYEAGDAQVTRVVWRRDGVVIDNKTASGSADSRTIGFTTPGTYRIGVTVIDAAGRRAAANMSVEVLGRLSGPTARFSASQSVVCAGTTVSFDPGDSTAGAVPIASYEWDVGADGSDERTTGDASPVSWTFDRPGAHPVELRVVDSHGRADTHTQTIRIRRSAHRACSGPSGPISLSIAGPDRIDVNDSRTVEYTTTLSGGNARSYDWSVSGASSVAGAGKRATVRAADADAGSTVTLSVNASVDGRTIDASKQIQVVDSSENQTDDGPANRSPTARIDAPSQVTVDTPVTFDGRTSSDPDGDSLSYEWAFRDGHTVTGPQFSRTFDDSGNYTVVLTVTDSQGNSDSTFHQITVDEDNAAPIARIEAPVEAPPRTQISFDGSVSSDPDGRIVEHEWEFEGNRRTLNAHRVDHSYRSPGNYTVTLTVTDDDGATDTTSWTVNVSGDATDGFRWFRVVGPETINVSTTDQIEYRVGFYDMVAREMETTALNVTVTVYGVGEDVLLQRYVGDTGSFSITPKDSWPREIRVEAISYKGDSSSWGAYTYTTLCQDPTGLGCSGIGNTSSPSIEVTAIEGPTEVTLPATTEYTALLKNESRYRDLEVKWKRDEILQLPTFENGRTMEYEHSNDSEVSIENVNIKATASGVSKNDEKMDEDYKSIYVRQKTEEREDSNDFDGDGIVNSEDNCPQSKNPEQIDSDGDGIGDKCDDHPNGGENDKKDHDCPEGTVWVDGPDKCIPKIDFV